MTDPIVLMACSFLPGLLMTGTTFWHSRRQSGNSRAPPEFGAEAYRQILLQCQELIWVEDLQGNAFFMNRAGNLEPDLDPSRFGPWSRQLSDAARETEHEVRTQASLPFRGVDTLYQIVKFPIRDDSGNFEWIGAVATPLSERSIIQASKMKSQVLRLVSHEIRTPLNGIMGLVELLIPHLWEADARKFSAALKQSVEQLRMIVHRLLDLSSIEDGNVQLDSQRFSLRDLLDERVELHREGAESKGIELICTIDPSIRNAYGDPVKISQILDHLLDNAIRHTELGSVELQASADVDDIEFRIIDTGSGMNPEFVNTVFDSGEDSEGFSARMHAGVGLGLSLVRNWISVMGGSLKVESRLTQGSEFLIRLPLLKRPEQTEAIVDWNKQSSEPVLRGQRTGKILVAEDNPVNLLVAEEYLRGLGYEVVSAIDGTEVIREFENQEFAAVLMDCEMPKMNGFQATRWIREWERNHPERRTPVIAVTANASARDREECLNEGMDDYLTKPITRGALAEILDRHASSHRQASEPEAIL